MIFVVSNLESVGTILSSRAALVGSCQSPDGNILSALDVMVTETICGVRTTGSPASAVLSCSTSWISCSCSPAAIAWNKVKLSAAAAIRRLLRNMCDSPNLLNDPTGRQPNWSVRSSPGRTSCIDLDQVNRSCDVPTQIQSLCMELLQRSLA